MTGKPEWAPIREIDRGIIGGHGSGAGVPMKQADFSKEDATLKGAKSYAHWAFTASRQVLCSRIRNDEKPSFDEALFTTAKSVKPAAATLLLSVFARTVNLELMGGLRVDKTSTYGCQQCFLLRSTVRLRIISEL